jgi:hypothetical protein
MIVRTYNMCVPFIIENVSTIFVHLRSQSFKVAFSCDNYVPHLLL